MRVIEFSVRSCYTSTRHCKNRVQIMPDIIFHINPTQYSQVDAQRIEVEFSEGDLLILPGADTWMEEEHNSIIEIVDNLIDRGVIVAAICGATVALANAGILNSRKHTSNGKGFLEMISPEYKGSDNYIDCPAVCDSNLITASGLAPVEFTYEVMKRVEVMKEETVTAWYKLYSTKESRYFYELMESMK